MEQLNFQLRFVFEIFAPASLNMRITLKSVQSKT
jgi:hypothetical protein